MRIARASLLLPIAIAPMLALVGSVSATGRCAHERCSAIEATGAAPKASAQTAASGAYIWLANQANYGVGTVSKISTEAFASAPFYREVARYASVTCQSDPVNGSKEGAVFGQAPPANLCADGSHGCCTRAESVPGANGMHQPVTLTQNRPTYTAVDANGDAWVLNSADSPSLLQSSVSKIANTPAECVERNGIPGIQTSSDANGDGVINTDCDDNGIPDDAATVCSAFNPKEFWGLDDECILFTVNTGASGQIGRALALGPGANAFGPGDAWAATYLDGKFYRIDGVTGAIKSTVTMTAQAGVTPHPFGAAIDRFGILWAPNVAGDGNCSSGGCLFFFDTNSPASQDLVQVPGTLAGGGFFGVALDGYAPGGNLVQQVWMAQYGGFGAYRYRPVRGAGFAAIKNGTWALGNVTGTAISNGGGLAVDNRSPAFVWVALAGGAAGAVAKIPADIPDGSSTVAAATNLFTTNQSTTVGAGVALDRDIWAVNQASSSATHFKLDAAGNVLNAATPDQVSLIDKPAQSASLKPFPNTYSDFSGFGYRAFTRTALFSDSFEGG